ncbi:MAG: protein kinase, partial [Planctomycetota bacterium]
MNLKEKYQQWCQQTANAPEFRQQLIHWYQQHQEKKIRYLQQYLPQWENFLEKNFLTSQEIQHFFNNTFSCSLEQELDFSEQKTVLSPSPKELESKAPPLSSTQTQQIGPYDILEKIGQGGMGVVYKVRHRFLNQISVLKLILPSAQNTPELLKRFHRESQIMAKLKHPHIVQVYDSGEENGQHYFCMEYVEGISLQKKIVEDIPIRESLRLLLQVLDALIYAHAQGVIHRDLKPENIFVTPEGNTKLGDFGLARKQDIHSKSKRLTQAGEIFGSPAYMAPEQAMGSTSQIDPQTDIYAIGACLYEMLTLHCPHEGTSLQELLMKVVMEPVKSPSVLNPDIHPDLESIILKALSKEKKDRYSTAKTFAEDIQRFLEGYPILAKRAGWQKKTQKWLWRNRKILTGAIAGFFVVVPLYGFQQWKQIQQFQSQIESVLKESRKEKTQYTLLKTLEGLKQLSAVSGTSLKELEKEKWRVSKELIEIACEKEDYVFAQLLSRELKFLKNVPEKWKEDILAKVQEKQGAKKNANMKRLNYWISEFKEGDFKNIEDAVFEVSKMREEAVFKQLLEHLSTSIPYFLNFDKNVSDKSKLPLYYFVVRVLGRLENTEAILLLNECFDTVGKYCSKNKEARQELEQIQYLLLLVNSLVNLKAYERNNNQFKENLEKYQLNFGTNSLFSKRSAFLYKKISSEEKFPPQLEKEPSTADADEANRKMLLNDWDGAIEILSRFLQKNPQNIGAYTNRGIARLKKNDLKGALEDFEFAIRLDPQSMEGYGNRGAVYLALQKNDEALLDFNKALSLHGEQDGIYLNRGITKHRKGDLSGSLADFTEGIRLNPKNVALYLHRGYAKQLSNDFQGALIDYNQGVYLDPKNANAFRNRAKIKLFLKDVSGSLQDYNE